MSTDSSTRNHAIQPICKVVGARIRVERIRQGWSQQDVADEIGVYQPAFALMETGRQNISVHTLCRIAYALGVNPLELIPESAYTSEEVPAS